MNTSSIESNIEALWASVHDLEKENAQMRKDLDDLKRGQDIRMDRIAEASRILVRMIHPRHVAHHQTNTGCTCRFCAAVRWLEGVR